MVFSDHNPCHLSKTLLQHYFDTITRHLRDIYEIRIKTKAFPGGKAHEIE